MSRLRRRVLLGISAVTAIGLATAAPAVADRGWHGKPPGDLPKVPLMVGAGGAVSSVDRDASQVGIEVLARGGNAADAAVATAAALGVTEPYSAGIGGGGFLVYYDAKSKKVSTIDGRETAPKTYTATTFVDPATGAPYPFQRVVDSGLSIGTPGTPALWDQAVRTFGTWKLGQLLKPAEDLATNGFVVDQTFRDQTAGNETRFRKFPETAKVYLPGNALPVVGSTFRNPDMAKAYQELRTHGVDSIYEGGRLGQAIVAEAQNPTTSDPSVFDGQLTLDDLEAYQAPIKDPVTARYRGYDVYGMGVPSSGGIAVAEILNLVEAYETKTGQKLADLDSAHYLHWFSEASATAFADRNRWVGDVPGVPVAQLTSQAYANTRACALFDPEKAYTRPLPFGDPFGPSTSCAASGARLGEPVEGPSTTHLVTADKWGNVASYTLTIESTGGSGITVPGYGFLLNNELTDFNFTPLNAMVPDPNLPGPGKRPRSSMSPTIVVNDGQPYLAVGSPGGATIITSVSQTLLGYLDRGLPLVGAVAAPRLSSRNGTEQAEPLIFNGSDGAALRQLGHVLSLTPEIGAVTAIHPLGGGAFEAAAETVRRGGGSAMVVSPAP
ncbi:MAG TPA: gamma-glutamyltransferase [Lapillicoccus sp.]|nr:gamma-glutamyltransferase [Lapillicoccus sp.]